MMYLTLRIDGSRYALDISRVVEILPLVSVEEFPRAPRGMAGFIDYGGTPVPVVDLSMVLADRAAHRRFNTRMVIVRTRSGGNEQLLAIIAEQASAIMRRDPSDFRDAGVTSVSPPDIWPVALDPEGPVYCIDVNQLLPAGIADFPSRPAAAA